MDDFLNKLSETDTRKKISIGEDIIKYIKNPENSIDGDSTGQFIDGLVPWIQNSNFKVSATALEIVSCLIERMKESFKPYLSSVFPPTVDRLGDSKDCVRNEARNVLTLIMDHVIPPNVAFQRLIPAFSHKNGRVREEVMLCLQNTLTSHGASGVTISRLLPHIVKLLSDSGAPVRDMAFNTIVHAYRHYGDKLRTDITNKYPVPPSRLPVLISRFDEIKASGLLLPSGQGSIEDSKADDEVDCSSVKSGGSIKTAAVKSAPPKRQLTSQRSAGQSGAGGVDENYFFSSFEDVPKINIHGAKDLEDQMTKIREVLSNANSDWDKRVDMIRRVRAVMIAGGPNYEEFYNLLRQMEPALTLSIKDLRSQVVREACITVAYYSQELRHKADHLCEITLPHLITLIPNSAKVMATSGSVCIRFIIQNTHHNRLIPIIIREQTKSKCREIRRAMCEFLEQLVNTWPPHNMEKHAALIAEGIKIGITDADSEARAFSRKAYWGYATHFKEEADKLLNSLDASYRKLLQGEAGGGGGGVMSASTSSQSLQQQQQQTSKQPTSAPVSRRGSLRRAGPPPSVASKLPTLSSSSPRPLRDSMDSLPTRGSPHPSLSTPPPPSSLIPTPSFRSTSAIDVHAARRAQARALYANASRMKAGSGVSLPRPRKVADAGPPIASPSRLNRPRGGATQSQPGSRSASPPRMSLQGPGLPRTRRSSGIPRSTGTSREPSPSRPRYGGPPPCPSSGMATPNSRRRSGAGGEMYPLSSRPRQLMTDNFLPQTREAENALATALVATPPSYTRSPCRKLSSRDDHSENESETSSICSERSYDSYRRNDLQDIEDIIQSCASSNWSDRKDGLMALRCFLRGASMLSGSQLRRVTEIFSKMIMDPHTKVFTLFLDTLMQLIYVHSEDLGEWLHVLLTKLLQKLGSDLLGSVQTKIHETLDKIRSLFPPLQQYQVIMHYITDPTQKFNSKVKLSTLTYLRCLLDVLGREDLTSSPDAPAALNTILQWTNDSRSLELRRASTACFIAMFNSSNMNAFTALLQQLPPACQNTASMILQNHLKKTASLDQSPSSLPISSVSTPGLQSPSTLLPRNPTAPRATLKSSVSVGAVDAEASAVSTEDVYRSLKKTTEEIRNYSFDGESTSNGSREQRKDSTSQDSGISQVSVNGATAAAAAASVDTVDGVDARDGDVISPSGRPPVTLPLKPLLNTSQNNGLLALADELDDLALCDGETDGAAMAGVLQTMQGSGADADQRKNALLTLVSLAKTGSTIVWNENFRAVLRLLVENLESPSGAERALVLTVLGEMMRRSPLVSLFLNYSELIILRVLKAHADSEKQVIRAAQLCAATVAEILPPDVVIRVLKPLVQMGDFPINQSAIKMLNKLVEAHPAAVVAQALPDVMPGLVKACDDKDSSVRKASVCCMVALHGCVGEETLKPYLEPLTGSKLKLLNLYIKRSSSRANSGTSSPRSEPLT